MGALVCRIELSKTKGVVITVENPDANVTQTVVMNGESITMTSAGNETSTIVQTPEGITLNCKTFTLDADTIACTSQKEVSIKASGAMTLEGQTIDLN